MKIEPEAKCMRQRVREKTMCKKRNNEKSCKRKSNAPKSWIQRGHQE